MIPFNAYLIAYLFIYLISAVFEMVIKQINVRYLNTHGKNVPDVFQGEIQEQELKKIIRYTEDKVHLNLVKTVVIKSFFLFILISGILPWLVGHLTNINFLLAGLVFFSAIGLAEVLADIPFDYYHSFIIEERYGFNTKTIRIWISDLIRSLLVMMVLGGFLLAALLWMLAFAGRHWWFWAWMVFLGFQLIMALIYPTMIAPLFNAFTPLEDGDLKTDIQKLAEKEGLNIEGIYQMDATRRTRHTNAYFSGIGKTKRIVLFDSLIQSHSREEILSILAHEIGHLKKNHIKKQLIITSIVSLLLFFVSSKLILCRVMYESFGFSSTPDYVGLFLVGILWGPTSFFLSPIGMAISRRFEREADFYSFGILRTAKPLSNALKKMARQNLSNLKPHPLYVVFNYSHPPVLERIEYLESFEMKGYS